MSHLLRRALHQHFYPRPLRGGRRTTSAPWRTKPEFLSTPSARRATNSFNILFNIVMHFYPRPLRGGRPNSFWGKVSKRKISIHALCEEGDSKNRDKISIFKQIIQHSARI